MNSSLHINDIESGQLPPGTGVDTVWVPSEAIACHLLEVPPVTRKKWLTMIPWMLEDRLLDRAEDLAFACGDRDGDGRVAVIAVKTSVLSAWRGLLGERGISYRRLVPDFFALPWRDGITTVAVQGERWLLRWGPWQGAAGSPGLLSPLLENLLPAGDGDLVVYADSPENLAAALDGGEIHRGVDRLFAAPQAPWLALEAVKPRRTPARWPLPAKVAAALAGVAVVLAASTSAVERRYIAAEADHLENELRRGYRLYFGDSYDFAMADFQRVVSSRIESGGDQAGVLGALQRLSDLIRDCNDCRVQRLSVADGEVTALLSGQDLDGGVADGAGDIAIDGRDGEWRVTLGGAGPGEPGEAR